MLPKLKKIPLKDRVSVLFLERGELDVLDGAFVLVDKNGVRTHIPVGSVTSLMLEPGTRVSHAAVVLAARVGCLLVWVGEQGVRVYSAGRPGGARSDRLLYQAQLVLAPEARLKVARRMYALRFNEEPPPGPLNQLRVIEAQRVRAMYQILAKQYHVDWKSRQYNRQDWNGADTINLCLSAATACLYGITEAAVLTAGYSPALGFIHSGKPLSFVYDIADLYKFDTVVPIAFRVAARNGQTPDREVRIACRDIFRKSRILTRIIPEIDDLLAAGEMDRPEPPADGQPVAFEDDSEVDP
jgi:CRISP-associated protein Cas1